LNGELCEGNYCSHYWFNNGPQPNQWIYPIMDWAAKEVGKKTYFIGADYAWGRGSLEAAKRHLKDIGVTLVGEEYYPMGTTDWAPAIQKIIDAEPDWILPMVPGNDYVVFLKQFFDFGLKEKIIVANTIFNEEDSPAFPPDIRDGLVTVSTYFMTLDSPQNNEFMAKLRKSFGKDILMTNFGENYYSMFYMWVKAVEKTGTTETEAVIKALEEQEPFMAPQGRLTVEPKTHAYTVNAYLGKVNEDGTISVLKSLGEVPPKVEIPCNAKNPSSTTKNPNP
jgi:urea transport system substrate-binding protein